MAAQLIDGRQLAEKIKSGVRRAIAAALACGARRPGLAVVKVGDDPASAVYVRGKRRACDEVGIVSLAYDLPARTSQAELLGLIDELNEYIGSPFKGQNAVVVGASNIVGRPMALELLLTGATATVCHRFTADLREHVSRADILIVAAGKPGLIPGAWVRPDSTVIDVGMNRTAEGHLIGDVEFGLARERAAWITPVPGGVGPMTVAMLMHNTVRASQGRGAARAEPPASLPAERRVARG